MLRRYCRKYEDLKWSQCQCKLLTGIRNTLEINKEPMVTDLGNEQRLKIIDSATGQLEGQRQIFKNRQY